MEFLVALGVSSACVLSIYQLLNGGTQVYFDSMTVIVIFVLLGKITESKAMFTFKSSLLRLNRSIPRRGRKQFLDKKEAFVPLKEIAKNDLIAALAGEKIVLDGLVLGWEWNLR